MSDLPATPEALIAEFESRGNHNEVFGLELLEWSKTYAAFQAQQDTDHLMALLRQSLRLYIAYVWAFEKNVQGQLFSGLSEQGKRRDA